MFPPFSLHWYVGLVVTPAFTVNVTVVPTHTVWFPVTLSTSGFSLIVNTEPVLVTLGAHVPLTCTVYVPASAVAAVAIT